MPARIRDLVIVLPGISGSVLQKDGRDVWALSGTAAWQNLRSLGGAIAGLKIACDDESADDLGDGVRATSMIGDLTLVPGLVKIDGYTGIRRLFSQQFAVTPGSLASAAPANYFEFPYDWRRHNAVAARRLHAFVRERLPRWREHSGAGDAKVVLIAHSMGGLVARHYLEVLGGWRDCRALISFGTPYRGSVNAVDFLANGYKRLFLDFSEVLRSFASVYELLPIYPMLKTGGEYRRVAEVDGLPAIERARAEEALRFHRRIEAAVTENRKAAASPEDVYKILPVVGTRQTTQQSAVLTDGRIRCDAAPPRIVPADLADGDGTVPRVSAVPIELSEGYRDTFVAEKHASLQNNDQVLLQLRESIKSMQSPGTRAIRGAEPRPQRCEQAAIALAIDDVYGRDEAVTISASVVNGTFDDFGGLEAVLQPLTLGASPRRALRMTAMDTAASNVVIGALKPGAYRITASPLRASSAGPFSVTDVFGVVD